MSLAGNTLYVGQRSNGIAHPLAAIFTNKDFAVVAAFSLVGLIMSLLFLPLA